MMTTPNPIDSAVRLDIALFGITRSYTTIENSDVTNAKMLISTAAEATLK